MTPIELFHLDPLTSPHDGQPAASTAFLGLRRLEKPLPGVTIEGQYRSGDHLLLVTSDDCPFEECLHLLLFSPEGSLRDQLDISLPYAAGIFSEIQSGDGNLEFTFFGQDHWMLEIVPMGFRPLGGGAPAAVRKPGSLILSKRYLRLQRQEQTA